MRGFVVCEHPDLVRDAGPYRLLEIEPELGIEPMPLAAAAAVHNALGSWDESDPIIVTMGTRTHQVSACFDGGHWRASVT